MKHQHLQAKQTIYQQIQPVLNQNDQVKENPQN